MGPTGNQIIKSTASEKLKALPLVSAFLGIEYAKQFLLKYETANFK